MISSPDLAPVLKLRYVLSRGIVNTTVDTSIFKPEIGGIQVVVVPTSSRVSKIESV